MQWLCLCLLAVVTIFVLPTFVSIPPILLWGQSIVLRCLGLAALHRCVSHCDHDLLYRSCENRAGTLGLFESIALLQQFLHSTLWPVFGKKHRGTHAIGPCPPRLMSELPFFPTCCYIETFCPSDTLSMLFFPAAVSVLDLSIFADVHDGFASSVAVPSSFGLLPAELHPIAHLHALVAGMQVAWCHCSAPGVQDLMR